MKRYDYLLVGAGLASARAAKAIRQVDEDGSILIVGEEPHPPYDRPPLSKELLRGELSPEDIVSEASGFYKEQRVELQPSTRITALEADAGVAHAAGETIGFERALIATGGEPRVPAIPGAGLAGVFTLRSSDDSVSIRTNAKAGDAAVVVGGGYIGLEVAASLAKLGLRVTLVEAAERVWPRFAPESLSEYASALLTDHGVSVLTDLSVESIEGEAGRVSSVRLSDGRSLPTSLCVLAVGIVPRIDLAESAGISVDDGVVVDEYLRSSVGTVYAAGDIAMVPDPIFERSRRVEHYGQAEYTGLTAGFNMAVSRTGKGEMRRYELLTYVWTDVFDMHLESAGDPSAAEQWITRGDTSGGSFYQFGLAGGRLRCFFAVNRDDSEFSPLHILIRTKRDLSGKLEELADPAVVFRDLLK
jgi:NADPH-dependent 2,4-dienoyl-CoA reductase/sulfur reductase-like enzyme